MRWAENIERVRQEESSYNFFS